jgi:KaiC/GvpD/RAD55 family RecA-like ATPase
MPRKAGSPPPDESWDPTDADDPRAPPKPAGPTPGISPTDIVTRWISEGPLVRIPTGIEALDRACRGGLPVPWRAVIVGAPSAGKTFVETAIADRIARALGEAGACVGMLGVDEEPEDLTVRLAQIAGFTVLEAEQRDPEVLQGMVKALESVPIRLYDARHTIESAAKDLAEWARAEGRRGVLFIDSIQAARSEIAAAAKSPRESVELNMVAIRTASTSLGLLVVTTSEANRASYRNDAAASETNDMAAGAESRAIEFGAQTMLVLRTPKDNPDVIHVRIAKNRRAYVGEFWLRLDREHHTLTECDNPTGNAADREGERQAATSAQVSRDAETLAALLLRHPGGLGSREVRAVLKEAGHGWGVNRLDTARIRLARGHKGVRLVETDSGKGKKTIWSIVRDGVGDEN